MRHTLLKHLKALSLATVATVPMFYAISCGECKHQEGELISLFNNNETGAKYKCKKCHKEYIGANPTPSTINMPIININGDFSKVSKEEKTKMTCSYQSLTSSESFEADCTVKIQGAYSTTFPKVNYNIAFFEKNSEYKTKKKVTLNPNWTNENKYTLKANWCGGHLRNIVTGRIVASALKQEDINDPISKVYNCGCIDGFPIAVYQNKIFQGLYTLNVAKDHQMFKIKDGSAEPLGILSADDSLPAALLNIPIDSNFNNGIENEYCYTNDTSWMVTSFNNLINFNVNNVGDAFKAGIGTYLDMPRTLDYLALVHALCLPDNVANNVVFVTFDGTKWFPSLYDLDISLGRGWYDEESIVVPFNSNIVYSRTWNTLFPKIENLYSTEIKNKYTFFRQSSLKIENITKIVVDFENTINSIVDKSDLEKWTGVRAVDSRGSSFICDWISKRLEWLDNNW